ncbi:ABC transporter ATP-binding protein/permease [Aetokthonos hydrillicola Thurmond2011]|jgi:ATP-binding cassette subfamily B protein|uniref:ABC transporter ATP-binding protein/permease n=2 Tax=Aetokthonos TaxID=1550243 RepID=A0AAP5M8K5_9CYAN|nr:ABC transporter ATP-binding protein [Aetokthonos hydrillicola]MBO3463747.1 ABC transporter ATP-binding protein [Aetokthonos hydrillicola CCALA 1050]MBW4585752.1 ABC transporter ATP-binding protein/permease [Aetokthonos hydrillicola CCALA 1050]MDR9899256.1 ABC transporter ATP-binding protein/permease [Aetokthonos hydrillicola Thurmond2011]
MAKPRRLIKLLSYLRPHWREAFLGILALLIVNGLGAWIPLLIRDCIDKLSANFRLNQVINYVVLIFLLSSSMWLIRMASRLWLFGVGRQVEFDLKQKIFEHLLKLEPSYFNTNTGGDLISRATNDVDNIRRLLGFAVLSLANIVFAYAITLPFMLSINVQITLAALVVYPLMIFLVQLFSNRLRHEQSVVQESLSDISELIQEDISGIALIKIYAQEQNERRAFAKKNKQLLQANLQLAKSRNTLFPLISGLASVSSLVIIWLGASRVTSGSLAVGDFIALLIYIERLIFPTTLLGFTITTYQRGEVSIDRLEAILSAKPKIQDGTDAIHLQQDKVKGELTAKNFSYTYPGSNKPALDNINFTIVPGEIVAIVGPIGSGKSTLANALPRLLDIGQGQLFLDGVDITKLALADLRSAIAYVPQDSFLFSTTIKNNIRYEDPISEQQEVESVAKVAQIHDEILYFPQQYETIVGERGITLSGGQRQRTALARALLVDAPILVLDDALSSVDNQTATAILKSLSRGSYELMDSTTFANAFSKPSFEFVPSRRERKTIIFITHQLSAASAADRIFVVDNGQIVQAGTQIELLQQPGLYRNLWNQHQVEELLQ